MAIQYNLPIKVLDPKQEYRIQMDLQGYRALTDKSGNLCGTAFSRENVAYVGDLIVIKTIKPEVIGIAQRVLSGIEGLLLLPSTECELETIESNSQADPIKRSEGMNAHDYLGSTGRWSMGNL